MTRIPKHHSHKAVVGYLNLATQKKEDDGTVRPLLDLPASARFEVLLATGRCRFIINSPDEFVN
jgi:hypothetical protein